jgi:hypothetical protein
MKRWLLVLFFSFLLLWHCKKKDPETPEPILESGMMKNFNGSGCGWLIRLDNADENGRHFLEPQNLDQFNIALVDSQKVLVRYKSREDLYSICMSGKIVDIMDIKTK